MAQSIFFEAVLFDLGNTLLPFTPKELQKFVSEWYLLSGAEAKGIRMDQFAKAFGMVFDEEMERMLATGEETQPLKRSSRMGQKLSDIGCDGDSMVDGLLRGHSAAFSSCLVMTPQGREVLKALRSARSKSGKEVRIGLVTNAPDGRAIREFIDREDLAEAFDTVVISEELGTAKPFPGIFLKALSDLGVPPDSAVYVGDRYFVDIEGAALAGMRAVYVREYETVGEPPKGVVIKEPVINSIRDLLPLLGDGSDIWERGVNG